VQVCSQVYDIMQLKGLNSSSWDACVCVSCLQRGPVARYSVGPLKGWGR